MPPPVLVSAALVRALHEALHALGFDAELFRKRVQRHDDWLPVAEFETLLAEAVAFTGDPALGLRWGALSPMMQLDLAPAFVASAPTLRDALQAIVQLQYVFFNRAQCHVQQRQGRGAFTLDLSMASELGTRVLTDLTLSSMVRGFRYFGLGRAVRRLAVTFARPAYADEYERALGAKVRFEAPQSLLEFASAALDKPLGTASEPLYRMIDARTKAHRQEVLNELTCAEQVERHLSAALPRLLSAAETAQLVGASERSLRRWLSEERKSYTALVDHVQRQRAEQLLATGQLSIKQVAYEVGFKSPSGLYRALKRWNPAAD